MSTTVVLEREHDRERAIARIRGDLNRCLVCAEALTLPEVALFVQRALDEIDASIQQPVTRRKAGRRKPS